MHDFFPTAALPDTERVSVSEPVQFVSEYRCFVLHGDILDLRPYTGDPSIFPDANMIRAAVEAYAPEAPAGCTVDFGVTGNGRTLVFEVNDGYALGAYGLAPLRYANLFVARWTD